MEAETALTIPMTVPYVLVPELVVLLARLATVLLAIVAVAELPL